MESTRSLSPTISRREINGIGLCWSARFRRSLMRNHPKHLEILNLAADKGNWGKPTPPGSYRVFVECAVEHGSYYKQSATITCGETPASAIVKHTGYFDDVAVQYGPKGGRA